MKTRKELSTVALLVTVLFLLQRVLPVSDNFVISYNKYWYSGLQIARGWLFNYVPFSIGDLLYFGVGALLLVKLMQWVWLLRKIRLNSTRLGRMALRFCTICLCGYLVFLVSWGINYNREPLAQYWGLQSDDTLRVRLYDSLLIERLNVLSAGYRSLDIEAASELAGRYYKLNTDAKVKKPGLKLKPSLYGWFLDRLAIEGYFNPFTGEGQVSRGLPNCLIPFVVCHEMAHQAGIAAEGDANLFAYCLCMASGDPAFQYSASLNVWLYADRRLKWKDTAAASQLTARLNNLTKEHLDTLEQMTKLYDNDMSQFSSEIYDKYLKLHRQKDGVRSYGNLLYNAWLWDRWNQTGQQLRLKFPPG